MREEGDGDEADAGMSECDVICAGGDAYERKKENSDQGLKPRNFLKKSERSSKYTTLLDSQKGVQVLQLVHNGCS